jgi:uncharacterized protein (TIGR00730 family)
MAELKSICVYCGSGPGVHPAYVEAAQILGAAMADQSIRLVYGGGSLGLMGAVARAVLDHHGKITGIIPEFLKDREKMLKRAHELIITEDMHVRKRTMFDKADAFVALPGGIGTLEELIEMLTWAQLGRHRKPVLVANIEGFWNPLFALLDHMRQEQFIRTGLDVNFLIAEKAEDIIPMLQRAVSDMEQKFLDENIVDDPDLKRM